MEVRIDRVKPGLFSIHAQDGQVLNNVEHVESRYVGDAIVTHVRITTKVKDLGKFEKPASTKRMKHEEQHSGSESEPV